LVKNKSYIYIFNICLGFYYNIPTSNFKNIKFVRVANMAFVSVLLFSLALTTGDIGPSVEVTPTDEDLVSQFLTTIRENEKEPVTWKGLRRKVEDEIPLRLWSAKFMADIYLTWNTLVWKQDIHTVRKNLKQVMIEIQDEDDRDTGDDEDEDVYFDIEPFHKFELKYASTPDAQGLISAMNGLRDTINEYVGSRGDSDINRNSNSPPNDEPFLGQSRDGVDVSHHNMEAKKAIYSGLRAALALCSQPGDPLLQLLVNNLDATYVLFALHYFTCPTMEECLWVTSELK